MSATRVFIIDDEKEMLKALETLLYTAGFNVYTKMEADHAIEEVIHFNPDVVLVDYLISGKNGRELTREIKNHRKTRELPVAMISAHPQAEEAAEEAGANAFIRKPFDMDTLTHTIKRLANS